jgi:hypothetical protein
MVTMDEPTPITPPGWYDDGHGHLRWWDGSQWTEHTAPLASQAAPAASAPVSNPTPARQVEHKRSKLVWILPIAVLLSALIGGLVAIPVAVQMTKTEDLERTYAAFLVAQRSRDCAALEAVTTQHFREDLFDDRPCSVWAAHPPVATEARLMGAFRIGPFGVVAVEERIMGISGASSQAVYMLVHEDGRWRIDDGDSEVDGDFDRDVRRAV